MLDMPHHQSAKRAHMSRHDRAAQFAPFAALYGHEEAIEETARLTDERIILDESQIEKINEKLRYLADNLSQKISISVTYFCPDQTKQGGAYLTDIGYVKKMNEVEHFITMDRGMKIEMNQIVSIEEGTCQ